LLDDMLDEPRLKPFKLGAASGRPPKSAGGLDIEGLCATPKGDLLIGFRNPVPKDHALLVPLTNPEGILKGKPAKFGEPMLLNLGGRGVRDITRWRDGYLIAAGPAAGGDDFALYTWAGGDKKPKKLKDVRLKHFHAEAIIVFPGHAATVELLSDDGAREVNGIPAKNLPDPNQRHFRGRWGTVAEKPPGER
jgi:hypothetical protein